jgi:hypothetical protein
MPGPQKKMSPQERVHTLRREYVLRTPREAVTSRSINGRLQLLIQWEGFPDENASWVYLEELRRLYPLFRLRFGIVYHRCRRGPSA